MKNSARVQLILSLLFLASLANARTFRGNDSGGGIVLSAEFATVGRSAIELLTQGDPKLSLAEINQKIANTKVIPVPHLCYKEPVYNHEYCQDAHYDQLQNVILFVPTKWDEMSCKQKLVLAAHEYFRAAQLETEDYFYSGRFLNDDLAQCWKKPGTPKEQLECADLVGTLEYKLSVLCQRIKNMKRSRE